MSEKDEALNSQMELKRLCTTRSSVKGRITKFKNYLETLKSFETICPFEVITLRSKLNKFELLFTEFEEVQRRIESINGDCLETELSIRDLIEQEFHHCIALAQQTIDRNAPRTSEHSNTSSRRSSSHCRHHEGCGDPVGFKLPTIKIPNFDGTYFKWLEFRDTFTSLVHKNPKIKNIHKYYYLNSYLEGEAARVISNLEVTDDNYTQAWEILYKRYNNKRQLVNNHLKSLLSVETVRETEKSLRFIIDHITKNLRALKTLGLPTDSWDALIIFIICEKLDSKTSFKWEESKGALDDVPTLNEFFDFLKNRADVLESVNRNKHSQKNNSQAHLKSQTQSRALVATSTNSVNNSTKESSPPSSLGCLFCKGEHRLYECSAFKSKSADDRMSFVSSVKLCHNCLRTGHSARRCRLPGGCRTCKHRHNSLLHESLCKKEEVPNAEAVSMSAFSSSQVLLCTAEVYLFNPTNNKNMTARALLDSGSQSSFITERVMQHLQLIPQPSNTKIVGIGDTSLKYKPERCAVRLQSKRSSFSAVFSCLVLPSISDKLPKVSFNTEHLKLSGFSLADPSFNKSDTVDMLIGADLFWTIIESEQQSLGDNNPVLRNSKLGWLVAGPMFPIKYFPDREQVHCNLSRNEDLVDLHNDLARFWELEKVPDRMVLSEEEQFCEQHFLTNTTRTSEGRFCVKFPLRDDRDCLGDSFRLARKRFINLESRFKRQPLLKDLYFSFMNEYAQLGHLSETKYKESSPTT